MSDKRYNSDRKVVILCNLRKQAQLLLLHPPEYGSDGQKRDHFLTFQSFTKIWTFRNGLFLIRQRSKPALAHDLSFSLQIPLRILDSGCWSFLFPLGSGSSVCTEGRYRYENPFSAPVCISVFRKNVLPYFRSPDISDFPHIFYWYFWKTSGNRSVSAAKAPKR